MSIKYDKKTVFLFLLFVCLKNNLMAYNSSINGLIGDSVKVSSPYIRESTNSKNNLKGKEFMELKAKRIARSYRQTINEVPSKIFPLLCPVREADWLDDWDYKTIYSESGVAELNSVWTTSYWKDSEQTWIITKHDIKNYEIQFARFVPKLVTSVLDLKVIPKDAISSYVDITYTYTSLSEEGNIFLKNNFTEEFFNKNMKTWEESMNYFFRTGEKLKTVH